MKKGRPAVMLSVLCKEEQRPELEHIIFTETTTLGIRRRTVERTCLDRKQTRIETRFGKVGAKAAYRNGRLLKVLPEYEECRRIAAAHNLPLQYVYAIIAKDGVTGHDWITGHKAGTEK